MYVSLKRYMDCLYKTFIVIYFFTILRVFPHVCRIDIYPSEVIIPRLGEGNTLDMEIMCEKGTFVNMKVHCVGSEVLTSGFVIDDDSNPTVPPRRGCDYI